MIDVCAPDEAGSRREFDKYFTRPILKGHKSDATDEAVRCRDERLKELKIVLDEFMLRRLKGDVLNNLPTKSDKVILCQMTPIQQVS